MHESGRWGKGFFGDRLRRPEDEQVASKSVEGRAGPGGHAKCKGKGTGWFPRPGCRSRWKWPARSSLDLSLHTQQQVVSEQWGQWEFGGSLPAVATQLSTHSQAGQVLEPPWLVFHA